jgi:PAS domain S-box-containing protein
MNVLIVDDNATNRKLLRAQLEAEGLAVSEATDGVEALAALGRGQIEAVISDILMPNMDGFRLCLEIRKLPHLSALPFIIYTNTYDSPVDRQLAQSVGADGYVVKPGPVAMIMDALRDATRQGATRFGAKKITGDTVYVLKQYNESLVGKLEERNIELTMRNEALQQAERQLRLQSKALETAANAIIITDRSGTIQWANPAFTRLTGYAPEEVLGKTPRVLKSGRQDQAFYRGLWQTILSGQTWQGEFINRRKDGNLYHGEQTITPVRSEAGTITHFIGIMTDVTARKRVEEELRVTHEKLRQLLAHSPVVIYTLKIDGQNPVPVVVSDNIQRLLGVSVAESTRYQWWFDSLHPEDRDRVLAVVGEGMQGQGYSTEYRVRHKDGSYRWVEDNNRVIRDASGEPKEAVGVWTDITERKSAGEALRASEERFRQLAENINEVFWMTDPLKNQMLYISPAYEKIWGRTCDSLYQSPHDWLEAIHPEDRERVLRDAMTKQASGEYDETYRIRRPGGEVRWIRDRAFPIRDAAGEVYRVVGTAEDVTARKEAEQRLSAHHAVTQVLTEAATLADAAGKILPIICRNLQWDVGELWTVDPARRRLRCVEIWHPPSTEFNEFVAFSRAATFAAGEGPPGRVWESGRASWIADVTQESDLPGKALLMRIGLRSGIAFPIKLRNETFGVIDFFSAQIRPPDEELLAMFATVGSQIGQFIKRRRMEEQFRQSQKMEAFGQLAGGVAHDFNNILAVIMGYTSLLLENEDIEAGAKDEMRQVYAAGERAANLTRQLLTFSRKREMEAHPLDLNAVIANMIKMLGRIIGEDIKLQCNYASNLPTVQADEGMMEQVLMNLAVNARDAMAGGGQLIIDTRRAVIDAAAVQRNPQARAGEFVCVSVRDTGCGMTPEIQARIFEPFFTTKGVGKGTGLGLATVYGIVQQHQGWQEVESQVGAGTVFKVFLPASTRAEAAAERAVAETKARGGSETILLVEDELALRTLARLVLQRHGYRVLEAGTGAEALAVWEQHDGKVDLLLTDMVMPEGMTGRELAKQLQTQRPELKVIYTSGYSLDAEGTAFRLRQTQAFLQKPYNPQKMIKLVRETLDGGAA